MCAANGPESQIRSLVGSRTWTKIGSRGVICTLPKASKASVELRRIRGLLLLTPSPWFVKVRGLKMLIEPK